jgi:hypothetical protein
MPPRKRIDLQGVLTAKEAAARAGVTEQRIRFLLGRGRIPGAVQFGGVWLIPVGGLDEWRLRDRDRRWKDGLPADDPRLQGSGAEDG